MIQGRCFSGCGLKLIMWKFYKTRATSHPWSFGCGDKFPSVSTFIGRIPITRDSLKILSSSIIKGGMPYKFFHNENLYPIATNDWIDWNSMESNGIELNGCDLNWIEWNGIKCPRKVLPLKISPFRNFLVHELIPLGIPPARNIPFDSIPSDLILVCSIPSDSLLFYSLLFYSIADRLQQKKCILWNSTFKFNPC